jgi:hypothetical protein
MNSEFTPWARGALTDDQRLRLRLHLAGEHRLIVNGTTPGRYMVRIYGPLGQDWQWYNVPKLALWERIVESLAFIGQPLESDEDWERTKEAIRA